MRKLIRHTKDWLKAFLTALLVLLIIKTFIGGFFTIPSSSMRASLLPGDVIFVNKLSYGARMPLSLSLPFSHQYLPFTKSIPSFVEGIEFPYLRMPGFSGIRHNDILVFNYPMEKEVPVDHKSFYIKRCVGLPGDTLQIKNHRLFINGTERAQPVSLTFKYRVKLKKTVSTDSLQAIGIREGGAAGHERSWYITATDSSAKELQSKEYVDDVKMIGKKKGHFEEFLFPYDKRFPWNTDNYGPVVIPSRGDTIKINEGNSALYHRIIHFYEDEKRDNDSLLIPQMDYFFVLGDSRHNSSDSRFWGFLPENHIVGKAAFVLFSWDKSGRGGGPRWNRFFKDIK